MGNVTLDSLSIEDRKKLQLESMQELQEKQKLIGENRKAYKKMVNDLLPSVFARLQKASVQLAKAKKSTFEDLATLVDLKQEVYGKDGDQYTHSFTSETGITITIGHRVSDNWDDTVTAGLNKMDKFLASLGKDKDSQMLIRVIKKLLAKDAKGNLNSSRVLSLKKEAEKSENTEFIDAIDIILAAYQPRKSRTFVTVKYRDENGDMQDLPLDITATDFPIEKEVENEQQ
jgi:hypothetical protein